MRKQHKRRGNPRINAAALESLESRRLLSAGQVIYGPIAADVHGFQFDYRVGITTQQDGKILVAGYVETPVNGREIAIARYLPSGTIDSSYGSGGIAVMPLAGDQEAKSISLDNAGRAVLAGTTSNGGPTSFAVVRFTTTGSPDTTFDGDGLASASFSAGLDCFAWAVAIQADGKIVAGGTAFNGTRYDFALARFNTNGTLDNTFDGDGKRIHNAVSGNSEQITDMTIQGDGKIVVSGASNATILNDGNKWVIARYNTNGSNDNTFGTGGVVITSFAAGTTAAANGVTLEYDGKIIAVGSVTANSGVETIGLARYDSTGALDPTFDGDGKMTFSFGPSDRPGAVAMQTLGGTQKIVVSASTGSHGNAAVARINLNGTLDTSFDGDGKVVTSVLGFGVERVPGLAIQNNPYGRIITGGVDTENQLIMTIYDGNQTPVAGQPDVDWVSDSWVIVQDHDAAGLSYGDIITAEGVIATFGVDGFDTIPTALGGVSNAGRSIVLAGADNTLVSDPFTITGLRKLDVQENRLIVHNMLVGTWNGSNYTDVSGYIQSGRNDGTWDGSGIMTSQLAAVGAAPKTTIGVADGATILGLGPGQTDLWSGQTVTDTDVLIMYTWGGDGNLDGTINADDYALIDFNHDNPTRHGYYNGDFNYDGEINADDYAIIDFVFNAQGPPFL